LARRDGRGVRQHRRVGFSTPVFPFLLRGLALIGINSVPVAIAERHAIW
jgi:hypothetical protein